MIKQANDAAEGLREQGKMETGYYDIELVRGVEVIDHIIEVL